MARPAPEIVVTGANGLVGAQICRALADRGASVRAVVRKPGAASQLRGITEVVGDFTDPDFAAEIVAGASAVITTVHPMGSDRATQHQVGVQGTVTVGAAAAAAGVGRLIHISTTGVYDRSPGVGDVDEDSALVGDDADDYQGTKRDADLALAEVDGITRVLVRPAAILGPGSTSIWNTLRPAQIREHTSARHANPRQTFGWVHVSDLATISAELATGEIRDAEDPASGPVAGACTAVNLAVPSGATQRDYYEAVTAALGLEPIWDDGPAWTGQLLADRAQTWGWTPTVDLARALGEVAAGLSPGS